MPLKTKKQKKFQIEVEDFGPITNGKISIEPLTIIIGPNNSGKSYLSMLIRSVARVPNSIVLPSRLRRGNTRSFVSYLIMEELEIEKFVVEIEEQLKDSKLNREEIPKTLEFSNNFIQKIRFEIIKFLYETNLKNELVHSFASTLNELKKNGKDNFKIKINELSLNSKKNKLIATKYPQIDPEGFNNKRMPFKIKFQEDTIVINNIDPNAFAGDFQYMSYLVVREIVSTYISELLINFPFDSYYLPAARSGILQGHKLFTLGMVDLAPRVGIEEINVPKFSGVVADFIKSIINLPEEKGPFYKLACDLSNEIIDGDITFKKNSEYNYPEINYLSQDMTIPIHRSSSTVSELAPLILYLKYYVRKGTTLIIEEPEAHLHPKNQLILARYLVKLIRNNINLIITTHSDYLLDQLNNFLLLGKLDSKNRKNLNYDKNDFLNFDEVGAYLFEYDKENNGHEVKKLEITEDGIDSESFNQVLDTLYDETNQIRRIISKGAK